MDNDLDGTVVFVKDLKISLYGNREVYLRY